MGKKLYAVIGDTGASGAYYIASAADEIIVNPSSLVGSIGVIMPNYGVSQSNAKVRCRRSHHDLRSKTKLYCR